MSDTVMAPMSESAQRIEIFTGAGRRRSWSSDQKAAIVAESLSGSGTVSAVARRHGVAASQLYAWRRQSGAACEDMRAMSFASVMVAPAAIEVVLGGATIRVPPGSDEATLRAVLAAVQAVSR